MIKKLFSNYIKSSNKDNSGKATSYIRALDLLSTMLEKHPLDFQTVLKSGTSDLLSGSKNYPELLENKLTKERTVNGSLVKHHQAI